MEDYLTITWTDGPDLRDIEVLSDDSITLKGHTLRDERRLVVVDGTYREVLRLSNELYQLMKLPTL